MSRGKAHVRHRGGRCGGGHVEQVARGVHLPQLAPGVRFPSFHSQVEVWSPSDGAFSPGDGLSPEVKDMDGSPVDRRDVGKP